jgi:hypothetical protein
MAENKWQCALDLVGQKVSILAARYHYRGYLSTVTPDYVTLANASAIPVSGPPNIDAPQSEDFIYGSLHLATGAIEIIFQPRSCFAPLPGDDDFVERTNEG